jgi:hypothetical protein
MAHNTFLGTFNQAQYERFADFARSQLTTINDRIQHNNAEITRIGKVVFRYKRGVPQGLTADPEDSYMAKLLAAYEVLGGNPFIDLRTRDRTDPIFIEGTDETQSPHSMSNGEPIGERVKADAASGALMREAREWLNAVLDRRFNKLERKMRRALDYQDQLEQENTDLVTKRDGFEDLLSQIERLIADPGYRPLTADMDPLGLLTNAPYSSYDVAQTTTDAGQDVDPNRLTNREAVQPQRQQGVIVKPGQRAL